LREAILLKSWVEGSNIALNRGLREAIFLNSWIEGSNINGTITDEGVEADQCMPLVKATTIIFR
jgi:hypothetical protein